jgi:hypothetical protein
MTYGKISFEVDERNLVEGLLQTAIAENLTLLAAAQDADEANFYVSVRPILQSLLETVHQGSVETHLSESELRTIKGLLSSSAATLRACYQDAFTNNLSTLSELKHQWEVRENLNSKLEAPFVADNSCDADEEDDDQDEDD